MKKLKQKLLGGIILLLLIGSFDVKGQSDFICGTIPQNPGTKPAQPTNSVQLVQDLVPQSNDRQIEVNVRFWVFLPSYASSLTSIWTNSLSITVYTDALKALDDANSTYTQIPSSPKIPVSGYSYGITDAKIKFIPVGFSYIVDDKAYLCVDCYASSTNIPTYDANSINVFMGGKSYTFVATAGSSTYIAENYLGAPMGAVNGVANTPSSNIVYLNPEFTRTTYTFAMPGFTAVPTGTQMIVRANLKDYGPVLAHEFSHILGLNHPLAVMSSTCKGEPQANISPSFGCNSYGEVQDIVLESYTCTSSGNQYSNCSCSLTCGTDNLLSYNGGCHNFLSPQQLAIMHYYLRTDLKYLLSASGQTAALTRDPNFDYALTTNETWQDGDRYFKGNVRIPTNKTLTIKCGVAMTKGASFIVYPGGQLIVDGGTLTNISDRLWNGVAVAGNPSQPPLIPNTSNPGATLYQGIARLMNGATISNAVTGIKNSAGLLSNTGGIIFAQNTNFINNKFDAEFLGSNGTNVTPYPGASWFSACVFKTTGYIHDPSDALPKAHINILKSSGIAVRGCTFECTVLFPQNGTGIKSTDASYVVDQFGTAPTLFKNLEKGILINNVNPLKAPTIYNSKFENNWAYAIYALNTKMLALNANTIQVLQNMGTEGVYLNKCQDFDIRNNVFTESSNGGLTPGISVYQSKTGAHQVYKNSFSNLLIGINCMDENRGGSLGSVGLKMNCNRFDQGIDNIYDVALTYLSGMAPPTVMTKQGEVNIGSQLTSNLVRNLYGATCQTSGQNMWYISPTSTAGIDHGANTNTAVTGITIPSPPDCGSTLLSFGNGAISLDYPNHCPGAPLTSGGTYSVSKPDKLDNLNTYIGYLKSNNTDHINDFEIEASVASKISIFMGDTLDYDQSLDSVIVILENNDGLMKDADIQIIFAQMLKGDYDEASSLVSNLSGARSDWATLLTRIIELEQDTTLGILGANNGDDIAFLSAYAYTNNKDGQGLAQALLFLACDSAYTEPHAVPEGSEGARRAHPATQSPVNEIESIAPVLLLNSDLYAIYPNPAGGAFTIKMGGNPNSEFKYEISDLLGKATLSGILRCNSSNEINSSGLKNGVYLVALYDGSKFLGREKLIIIKQ